MIDIIGWLAFAIIMASQFMLHKRGLSPNSVKYLAMQAAGFAGNATYLIAHDAYSPLALTACFWLMVVYGWATSGKGGMS